MTSTTCNYAQLMSPEFQHWCKALGRGHGKPHRKDWELAFIAQALSEGHHFTKDVVSSGLGFGVGTEPLPALFVRQGCRITATDLPPEGNTKPWVGQHSAHVTDLEKYETLSAEERGRLRFRFLDMNRIPAEIHDQYDFCWSTSSMEHLGSYEHSVAFITKSLRCLKRGGTAVHVTELAVYPADGLALSGGTIWFTTGGLVRIADQLRNDGHSVILNFDFGGNPEDYYVDMAPYEGPAHLKLLTDGFVSTSVGLIITR